jgi:hypothetical protein
VVSLGRDADRIARAYYRTAVLTLKHPTELLLLNTYDYWLARRLFVQQLRSHLQVLAASIAA